MEKRFGEGWWEKCMVKEKNMAHVDTTVDPMRRLSVRASFRRCGAVNGVNGTMRM